MLVETEPCARKISVQTLDHRHARERRCPPGFRQSLEQRPGGLRRVSGLREFLTTLSEHGADIAPDSHSEEIVDRLGKVSMALAIQSLELRSMLRKSVEQRHLESGDVELF